MKALVWNPLWGAQGDLNFFKNCFVKHLNLQADILNKEGWQVDVIVPAWFDNTSYNKHIGVGYIEVSLLEAKDLVEGVEDVTKELYSNPNSELSQKIIDFLANRIKTDYDVILVWENPVPFLKQIFKDSLIINQMPGFFSRPPYPHTVCFDPQGLYKDSVLYTDFTKFISNNDDDSIVDFKNKVKSEIKSINPVKVEDIYEGELGNFVLLPLQTSHHYSFNVDSKGSDQLDIVLRNITEHKDTSAIIATQYISPHISEKPLTPNVVDQLQQIYTGFIYPQKLEKIPSISQYILPYVDGVSGFSSSLLVQAIAWDLAVYPDKRSYLSPLADLNTMDPEAKNKFLSTVIFRYQPLASKVTTDGPFLSKLLNNMIDKKKSGSKGSDLLCDFREINSEYSSLILKSFRGNAASKHLPKHNVAKEASIADFNKAFRAISNPDTKVVSFDVFDTLLERSVETPADAYRFIEDILIDRLGIVYDGFSKVRLNAELTSREKNTTGEITLDSIYDEIQSHYQVTNKELIVIKDIEQECELQLLKPRLQGRKIWELASEQRFPLVIISDMYHSHDFVEKALNLNGYKNYYRLYVSSTFNKRKKTGELYDEVINELLSNDLIVKPSNVLHIGDNKLADIDQAQDKGIRAFRIPRSIDRMRLNNHYKSIFPPRIGSGEKSRSLIAGLISSKLFDESSGIQERDTLFQGDVKKFGYAALGPFIYGFAKWLQYKAKKDKITKLYFLSREGWLLKQAYDIVVRNDESAIPSEYLYASRRATRVASIKCKSDIYSVAGQPFTTGVKLSSLLYNRFGISSDDIPLEILAKYNFNAGDCILESDLETKRSFVQLASELNDLILKQASAERLPYLNYLSSKGLSYESKPAIVDIGWKANMQASLGSLMHRNLDGYYYATLDGVDKWISKGHSLSSYLGDNLSQLSKDALVCNRHIVEFLICSSDKSLINMNQIGARFYPNFKNEANYSYRKSLITELHNGAAEFVSDAVNSFGELQKSIIPCVNTSTAVLTSYLNKPLAKDIELLKNVSFEDSFGGVENMQLVSDTQRDKSVWKLGYDNLHSKNTTNKTKPKPKPRDKQALVPDSHRDKGHAQEADSSSSLYASLVDSFKMKVLLVEKFVVKKTSTFGQYNKYIRSRDEFFKDSKSKIFSNWYIFIANKLGEK
ncbi:HAD family hydrolase [Cobetia marina]|uniref:HAD family hydrolase n=1 Tax=Cobetia marina TaxID=28258 RepID=UPI0012F4B99E|nr:hypothetical protein [Cobetia marina]